VVNKTPLLPWQILFSAYACGVFALAWPIPAGAAALAVICLCLAFNQRKPGLLYLAAAFGAGFGAAWLAFTPPPPVPGWVEARQKAALSGRVVSAAESEDGALRLLLEDVSYALDDGQTGRLPGKLSFTWIDPLSPAQPGDGLAVTARILPAGGYANPGLRDYAFFWALRGVYYRGYAVADKGGLTVTPGDRSFGDALRARIREAVLGPRALGRPPAETFRANSGSFDEAKGETKGDGGETAAGDDPAAPDDPSGALALRDQGRAMVLALLTGDRSRISAATRDLVARSGLAHSLALSGLHLGFAASLGWLLAAAIGRARPGIHLRLSRPKLAVILAAPFILGYVWLGGATPSLLRSALMFGCWGTLILCGRNRVLLDGLFFALAVILFASPLSVFDARLELSAAAVAGIAAFWPLGESLFGRLPLRGLPRKIIGAALGLLWTSLSAQAAVYPIVAANFGEAGASLWLNLLLNLVWLPVLGFAVLPLAAAGLFASLVPGLSAAGQALFELAGLPCQGLLDLLTHLEDWGFLDLVILERPEWPQVLGYALLLFLAASWRPGFWRRDAALAVAGLALLAAPGALRMAQALHGGASLTLIDVGQGQAILLEAPPGNRILVDGGGPYGDYDVGRYVTGPALTVNRPPALSRIILTHPHADHFKGLAFALSRFRVGALSGNGALPAGEAAEPFLDALGRSGLAMQTLREGDVLELGEGYALEVLAPPGDVPEGELYENNGSLVLRLTYEGRGLALLCGDAESGALRRLLASGRELAADVLVLPHHGSPSSHSRRFYKAVSPMIALASCGAYNAFGYPAQKVEESLTRLGVPLLDTGQDGAVRAVWRDPANPSAPPEISAYAFDAAPAVLRANRPLFLPLRAAPPGARQPGARQPGAQKPDTTKQGDAP